MKLTRSLVLGIVLLSVTLGPRMLAARHLSTTSFDDHPLRDAALMRFLLRSGFQIGSVGGSEQFPIFSVSKGECHLAAANMSPQGVHEALLKQLAGHDFEYRVVFRGKIYPRQPRWDTYAYDFWRKTAGLYGVHVPFAAVTGLVATPSCRLETINWTAL